MTSNVVLSFVFNTIVIAKDDVIAFHSHQFATVFYCTFNRTHNEKLLIMLYITFILIVKSKHNTILSDFLIYCGK